jgi:hypothetical protein
LSGWKNEALVGEINFQLVTGAVLKLKGKFTTTAIQNLAFGRTNTKYWDYV